MARDYCPRCHRALMPLSTIQESLQGALDRTSDLPEGDGDHQNWKRASQLGVMRGTASVVVEWLACHAGTCTTGGRN